MPIFEKQSKVFTQALNQHHKSLNDVSYATGVSISDLEALRDGTKLLGPRGSIRVATNLAINYQDLLPIKFADIEKSEREVIGEYIRNLRKSAGMTQAEFATAVGITEANLSHIENSHSCPCVDFLLRVASFFGINVLEIVAKKSEKIP